MLNNQNKMQGKVFQQTRVNSHMGTIMIITGIRIKRDPQELELPRKRRSTSQGITSLKIKGHKFLDIIVLMLLVL